MYYFCRNGTIIFSTFASLTILLKASVPILLKGSSASLPYKSWIPYNHENTLIFWLTYAVQAAGSITAGHVTIAVDTYIMVMMIQLRAHLEILIYRMHKFPELCLAENCYYDNPQKQGLMLGK